MLARALERKDEKEHLSKGVLFYLLQFLFLHLAAKSQ